MWDSLHLIRPQFLWLLLALPLLIWLLLKQHRALGVWQRVIDPQLHASMLQSAAGKARRSWLQGVLLWCLAWCLAVFAAAGPSFKKLPQPVQHNQQALIILLDMSASMAATDIKPSRAVRAMQKITDILRARPDGLTALIAYAGEAHTVTPLTTDTRTISSLMPALSPFIMPAPGSRPDKAIAQARTLASNAGVTQADILLITDGLLAKDAQRMANELPPHFQLKILAVGTEEGAPIPLPNGGFLRDSQQQIVLPKLDLTTLSQVSRQLQVPWRTLALDDRDWQALLNINARTDANPTTNTDERWFDLWQDEGHWLLLPLLPLVLLLFRRGALRSISILGLPLLALATFGQSQPVQASPWQTADQEAQQLLPHDPAAAAEKFKHPAWKASAQYQAGDYSSAAEGFAELPASAENLYNLGNALAQSGQLQEALEAYDQALAQREEFPQALHNRARVEELLKQQEQPDQHPDQNSSDEQGERGEPSESNQSENNQSESSQNNNNQNDSHQNNDNNENSDNSDTHNNDESEADSEELNQEQPNQEQSSQEEPNLNKPSQEGLSREEQEAMEKWLKQVPDNPGNLLQRKFLYQYRQRSNTTIEPGDAAW